MRLAHGFPARGGGNTTGLLGLVRPSLHDALELLRAACGDAQPESVDVAVSGCPPRSLFGYVARDVFKAMA